MRVIKFRAWNGNYFVLVTKLEFVSNPDGEFGWNINEHLGIPLENLCQYIGINDANGLEIYENCIVVYQGKKAVVKWDDEYACFVLEGEGGSWGTNTIIGSEIIVLGNIFDNPEGFK